LILVRDPSGNGTALLQELRDLPSRLGVRDDDQSLALTEPALGARRTVPTIRSIALRGSGFRS